MIMVLGPEKKAKAKSVVSSKVVVGQEIAPAGAEVSLEES
jgi:hypothetical protein